MGQAKRRGTKEQRVISAKRLKHELYMHELKQGNPKIGLPLWLFGCDVGRQDWVAMRFREIMAGSKPTSSDEPLYNAIGMTLLSN